jgi:hypothetical protein
MKRLLLLLLAPAVLAPTAETVDFRSGQISVRYDGRFHQRIRWLGDLGRNVVAFDPTAQWLRL